MAAPIQPELLSRVPLFTDLSAEPLLALADRLQQRQCAADEVICRQGESGDELYVVDSGRVRVSVRRLDQREVVLAEFGPGEFFGEMALLDGGPRSANARAVTDTSLLVLSRGAFLEFLAEQPQGLAGLLVALSRRLRQTDSLIQNGPSLAAVVDEQCDCGHSTAVHTSSSIRICQLCRCVRHTPQGL